MRVIKTVFTLITGAVIGIIAFIAVIFKMAGKVAKVADIPDAVVAMVKDGITSFVSYLLYADKNVLQKRRPDYRKPYSFYKPYYSKTDAEIKFKTEYQFLLREDALDFIDAIGEAYQEDGTLTVENAIKIYYDVPEWHSRRGAVDTLYGWDSTFYDQIVYELAPRKATHGYSVTLPDPIRLE